MKTFRSIRVEGWNIYPRNFNLIGKKRFRFVKRKGNRYMFPIRHSRLNFDRRATSLIERVIRRFHVYKYPLPSKRMGLVRGRTTPRNFFGTGSRLERREWGNANFSPQRKVRENTRRSNGAFSKLGQTPPGCPEPLLVTEDMVEISYFLLWAIKFFSIPLLSGKRREKEGKI